LLRLCVWRQAILELGQNPAKFNGMQDEWLVFWKPIAPEADDMLNDTDMIA
jgi:hypothetical protein